MAINLSASEFYISSVKPEEIAQSICEVAFVGRSNVGKSSVINAVCKKKNLARTSKTPGRTRAINIFSPAKSRWLVDLPGYGFARVSPEEKTLWKKMIEGYLTSRKSLKVVYVLIDAFVGPNELDFMMIDWLKSLNIPYKIIANKTDKVSNLNLELLKCKISEVCQTAPEDIFCISARTLAGTGNLINDIGNMLLK